MSEFADYRQNVGFILAGFDDHEDGDADQKGIQQVNRVRESVMDAVDHGMDYPLHQQPQGKKVEALECVKANDVVIPELPPGEYDHCGEPADGRYVAQHGRSSWRHPGERVRRSPGGCTGTELALAARGAENICACYLVAALCAERHVAVFRYAQARGFVRGGTLRSHDTMLAK